MNIKLNGNVLTLVSELNFEALKKCNPVYIHQDGKTVYAASTGKFGSLTNVGVTFPYANAEGKACLNIIMYNEDTPTTDVKELIMDKVGQELAVFKDYEATLKSAVDDIITERNNIKDSIQIN